MRFSSEMTPSEYSAHCDRLARRIPVVRAANATESLAALLEIARELAAKCLRGNKARSTCGACAYLGTVQHNEGCAVLRLEEVIKGTTI